MMSMTHDVDTHTHSPDPPQAGWTDELRARVKEMWKTQSAGKISDTLQSIGHVFSRNAVIGLVRRMGMAGGDKPKLSREKQYRRPAAEKPKTAISRNVSFADLQPGECRYPEGDRPFTFCGQPIRPGSSYCPGHHEVCWVAPIRRRAAA